MILLDTHVLVWFAEDHRRVGRRATKLVDKALQQDELAVAAVSFWELAMLAGKKRVVITVSAKALRRRILEQGIREIALDGSMGLAAGELAGLHGDPADRMIVATTMAIDATLMTADESLLGWSGPLTTLDARH